LELPELRDGPERRARMGEFGRNRVINQLEWQFEVPKLLAAYDVLFARS